MSTILVTGGCGYIGSHTVIALLEQGHTIHIIDNLCNSSELVLDRIRNIVGEDTYSRVTFHRIDLTDAAAVTRFFDQYRMDAVIHFAGLKAVGESVQDPLLYYRVNLIGTLNLLESMKWHGCKQLVFSSSATVYGDPERIPVDGSCRTQVTNPYGRTKLMIEEMLTDLKKSDETWNICMLRYFNPIGAHPSGTMGENPRGIPNNIMPYLQQVAVGIRPFVTIFGNDYPTIDGTGVRDYLHVQDLAQGHVCALSYILAGKTGTFNLGTGKGTSVLELIAALEKASGKTIAYRIGERRTGDIATVFADPSKAISELGWMAKKTIEEMCEDAWRWQNMNPNGFQ
jgi:UDP-glucose 4-epimerase